MPTGPATQKNSATINLLYGVNFLSYSDLTIATTALRGPAAILFSDTCSDTIAKLFGACFYGVSHNYRAIRCKMGIAEMCLCKTKYHRGGYRTILGGDLASLEKYRAIWGIAAIVSHLVARAIRNTIRANRFARIIRN